MARTKKKYMNIRLYNNVFYIEIINCIIRMNCPKLLDVTVFFRDVVTSYYDYVNLYPVGQFSGVYLRYALHV